MVFLQRHLDIVLEIQLGLGVVSLGLEVDHQVVLHSENRVDVEVRVVGGVDLVDDGGVVGMGDHEVDVSGTHRRAVHEVQEHTGGSIGGQRIRSRVVAVPVEFALLVGTEFTAQVVLTLVGVLEVVLAVGRCLPDIEDGACDGGARFHIPQHTVHKCNLAVRVGILNNGVTEFAEGGVGRPEGAEDNVRGGRETLFGNDAVRDFVNETSFYCQYAPQNWTSQEMRLTIPDRSRRRCGGIRCEWEC